MRLERRVLRDLAVDSSVSNVQGTYTFEKKISREGVLAGIDLIVYNPGKAAHTYYCQNLKLYKGSDVFFSAKGIEVQKMAKFLCGREIGTQTPGASAQTNDNIVPDTGLAQGANACYYRYPMRFGRHLYDKAYGLNVAALGDDPVLSATVVLGGADLDAAPQFEVVAWYWKPDAPGEAAPGQYIQTWHERSEPTATGDLDIDMPGSAGMAWESFLLSFSAVTTADAGIHGLYGEGGSKEIIVGRFTDVKQANRDELGIPLAEIEAIATAATWALYRSAEPIDSKKYNNCKFRARRGTTTTLVHLCTRRVLPNPVPST